MSSECDHFAFLEVCCIGHLEKRTMIKKILNANLNFQNVSLERTICAKRRVQKSVKAVIGHGLLITDFGLVRVFHTVCTFYRVFYMY